MSDSDLTMFVRNRLAEDAGAATVAGPHWHHSPAVTASGATTLIFADDDEETGIAGTMRRDDEKLAPFIARRDPARALREAAAGRRILARHRRCGTGVGYCDDGGHGVEGDAVTPRGCADLYDLASIWNDHPDYRQEWTP